MVVCALKCLPVALCECACVRDCIRPCKFALLGLPTLPHMLLTFSFFLSRQLLNRDNQKLGLLEALLQLNDWQHAMELMRKLAFLEPAARSPVV